MKRQSEAATTFGQMLRISRTLRAEPLRQATVALALGISASAVSQAESGQRPPKARLLGPWADALAVPQEALLDLFWLTQGAVREGSHFVHWEEAWASAYPGRKPRTEEVQEFLGMRMRQPLSQVLNAVDLGWPLTNPDGTRANAFSFEGDPEETTSTSATMLAVMLHGFSLAPTGHAYLAGPFHIADTDPAPVLEGRLGFVVTPPRGFRADTVAEMDGVPPRGSEVLFIPKPPPPQAASDSRSRLLTKVEALSPRQRELVLAYIDGLVDGGAAGR